MVDTRLALVLLALGTLSGCDCGGDAAPDAAAPTRDAAWADSGAPSGDVGQAPDAAPFVCHAPPDAGGLGVVEGLCEDLVAGEARLALSDSEGCGQPIAAVDLPHLPLSFVEGCTGTRRAADLRRVAASIAAGRVALDEAKRAACKALGRGADAGPYGDGGLIEPCRSLIVGLVPAGGACDYDEECAEGSCQAQVAGVCGGVCVAPKAPHEPCAAFGERCAGGTYCQPTDGGALQCEPLVPACPQGCAPGEGCVSGACLPYSQEGEACGGAGCAEGLGCVGRGDAGPGTCQRRADLGEACANDGTAPKCGACLRCDLKTSRCRQSAKVDDPCGADAGDCDNSQDLFPRLYCAPGGACSLRPRGGEACSSASPCLWQDHFCRLAPDGGDGGVGVCAPLPGLCEPCGSAAGLSGRCSEGTCRTGGAVGVCAPPAVEGEECGSRECAAGLFCDFGTCRPLPSLANADCAPTGKCTGGHYCGGSLDGGPRRCQPLELPGGPCERSEQCLSAACDETTHRCIAGVCPEQRLSTGCWFGNAFEFFGYLTFFALAVGRRRCR